MYLTNSYGSFYLAVMGLASGRYRYRSPGNWTTVEANSYVIGQAVLLGGLVPSLGGHPGAHGPTGQAGSMWSRPLAP